MPLPSLEEPDPLDHCINPVAIPLRIRQPLEDQHAQTLAQRVPSQLRSNGFASPDGESAGVLLKQRCMKMSLKVSSPPVMTMSERPALNSRPARCNAASELAQAASTTQLVPPRSSRLAIRPAATFPSKPGKEFSCQPT